MPKLAHGRDVYLTPEEIAHEALHQFDVMKNALSMRSLARALGVAPASLYHYFATEEAVIRAAVGLVFEEAFQGYLATGSNPLTDPTDPREFLILAALSLRRAFIAHFRIAPYMASAPESSTRLAGLLAVYGWAFEQLGVSGRRAGEAVFAYGNYVYGSILVSTSRRVADERFDDRPDGSFSSDASRPADAPLIAKETIEAIDRAIGSSGGNSDDEEELFVAGLRMLIAGMQVAADQDS